MSRVTQPGLRSEHCSQLLIFLNIRTSTARTHVRTPARVSLSLSVGQQEGLVPKKGCNRVTISWASVCQVWLAVATLATDSHPEPQTKCFSILSHEDHGCCHADAICLEMLQLQVTAVLDVDRNVAAAPQDSQRCGKPHLLKKLQRASDSTAGYEDLLYGRKESLTCSKCGRRTA